MALGLAARTRARGVEHDVGQGGVADIAGQQRIAARQQAERLDALHDVGDLVGRGRAAAPGAIAGMVRELDRVHRPDLMAQSLQGKSCCPIADVAVGDMALEREKAHGQRSPCHKEARHYSPPRFRGALRCRRPFVRAAAFFICRAPTRARWRRRAALPADALIFDLEDAVAPDAKEAARANVVLAAQSKAYGKREIAIRCNGLGTPWGKADIAAIATLRRRRDPGAQGRERGRGRRMSCRCSTRPARRRRWRCGR